jgi:hypothetical protein
MFRVFLFVITALTGFLFLQLMRNFAYLIDTKC